MPGVFDDGNNVGPLLGHVEQVPAAPVGKLDRVHHALGPDDVRHVGHGGSAGRPEVENLSKKLGNGQVQKGRIK